jgi:hypothetical protein
LLITLATTPKVIKTFMAVIYVVANTAALAGGALAADRAAVGERAVDTVAVVSR